MTLTEAEQAALEKTTRAIIEYMLDRGPIAPSSEMRAAVKQELVGMLDALLALRSADAGGENPKIPNGSRWLGRNYIDTRDVVATVESYTPAHNMIDWHGDDGSCGRTTPEDFLARHRSVPDQGAQPCACGSIGAYHYPHCILYREGSTPEGLPPDGTTPTYFAQPEESDG